jgi:hypothetical protein
VANPGPAHSGGCLVHSELLPFFHHNLAGVLIEDLTRICRSKHADRNTMLFQKRSDLPHSLDGLTRVVSEPGDRIPRPVAGGKRRNREIGVEPHICFFQPRALMLIKATSITKKSRLRYKSGKGPMMLPIASNDEPNIHLAT